MTSKILNSPLLEVEDINVSYGNIQVLWDVSFKVMKGEILTLLGPNGAGKTTTVKTILGLLHPATGTITFKEERIGKLAPFNIVEKGVVLIPEGRELFPKMSVMENLLLGAYTPRAEAKATDTSEKVFQLFPTLKERRKQQAMTLSGGEQQMLAIGRGLMSLPSLLILDEPSLGLAPMLVEKALKVISEINQSGVTVLMVEQNIRSALEIADRGYVIEAGRIVISGTCKELLDNQRVKEVYLGI